MLVRVIVIATCLSTIGKGVIDCQVCIRAKGKTSAHLKSVFKMSTLCSNASSKTWTPQPDRFIDDHLVEMFPLFDQARLQLVNVTNLAAVHTLLQLPPPNLVVDWVKIRTVGSCWPQSWSDEVWCFMSEQMHCLPCSVGWTPECLTALCNVILETEIFCRQYLNINISCNK